MASFNVNNFKTSHAYAVLLSFGSAIVVAVLAYLQAQPAATILGALSSLANFKTLAMGAIAVAISTAVHLLQNSIVGPTSAAGGGSGSATVSAKVIVPPVPPAPVRNERRALDMGRFLLRPALAAMALVALVAACTTAQFQKATTVTNASGQVCEIVVQATDPSLAPLCATAVAVTQAIIALGQQYALASASDAGASDAGPAAGFSAVVTNDSLYAYLAQHGAKTVNER